jgi:serine/threonine-protein kinase
LPSFGSSPTAAGTPFALGASVQVEEPPPSVQQVGRYELLLELASGGMATVYIGRQRGAAGFQRLVAIKRMHPHVSKVPELAASFMDEARIASLIRHPNVVNVHDVHEAEGEHLLVMDYVEGASLAAVMRGARKRRERIGRPAALRILVDALAGLNAAHEQTSLDGRPLGVVHRDATPHNILLGVDGSVRLTDFGIAKAAERTVNTATGLAKGKFRYMAPEQARGGALDRRVDVFAMGIVAWELLTGDRLFDADSDGQVLLAISEGKYRKPSSVDPSIPAELEAIVMRALAVNPNERWPTALAFADAITAWGQSTGEIASPAEVSRLVYEFCGVEVQARRASLSEVLAGTRAAPSLGGASRRHSSGGTGSTAGTSAPLTLDSVKVVQALSAEDIRAYRTRRRVLIGGAALGGLIVAGLLVAIAAVVSSKSEKDDSLVQATTASVTASAPVTPSAAAPESARVRVEVRSDRDIAEIRGPGVTNIEFGKAGVTLELPRSDQPVQLVVRMADGAEIEEQVVPKENMAIFVRSMQAASKPAAKPVVAPPPATTAKSKPPPTNPGLESNPYE